MRLASAAFRAWVETSVAPIAHANGLKGKGPVFRKRDGGNWIVFAVERRRLDPQQAVARGSDPQVEFRLNVGANIPATRAAWDDRQSARSAARDLTVHAPSLVLEPNDGEPWHTFDAGDTEGQARLTEFIRAGLGEALAALGRADAPRVLAMKLAFSVPLENLAPGHAEELLALADEAGDTELRNRIIEALKHDPVEDSSEEETRRFIEEATDPFGPGVGVHVMMPPRDDEISEPWRPGRRLRKTKEKLLADLASDRRNARRIAATRLGGWDGDADVVIGLRGALSNPDRFTGLAAASSLGQVADSDPETWRKVLALADEADAGPSELGEAIVVLARLDLPSRTGDAVATLDRMIDRYPAWARRLRALAGLLRPRSARAEP